MTQAIEPNQHRLGEFSEQRAAEIALKALQEAGFSSERVSLLTKTPTIPATEAKNSGVKGAIVGALTGGLAGLVLNMAKVSAVGGIPDVDPFRNAIGMVLAGSFIGAASIGVIAAMTGVNVRRGKDEDGVEAAALIPNFVIFAKDLQPDEVSQAKAIVRQNGGEEPD